MRLLVPLEIKRGEDVQKRLYFAISDQDEYEAENLLKKWGMNGDILGIHAGSGPLQGKKWPLERFGHVARALIDKGYFQHVLIFGGPEEAAEKKRLQEMIKAGKAGRTDHGIARAVNAGLGVTAAVIKRTSFFLSNDSGLMHVAAAVGTQVLGIFGPTNWHRTAPWGNGATFIRPCKQKFPCAPCLEYPFSSTRARIRCELKGLNPPYPCLDSIAWEQVFEHVVKRLTL